MVNFFREVTAIEYRIYTGRIALALIVWSSTTSTDLGSILAIIATNCDAPGRRISRCANGKMRRFAAS